MQYISFYKNRLPFKPKTNVVIYLILFPCVRTQERA